MTRLPARRRAEPRPITDREALRNALRYDPVDPVVPVDLEEAATPPPEPRLGLVATIALGTVLALLAVATVATASLAEVASPPVAVPALEQLFASLTEVDGLVALQATDLRTQIDAGAPTLQLRGFLIDVPVAVEDARAPDGSLDPARFRTALLATVAISAYEGGLGGTVTPRDPVLAGAAWALTASRYQQAFALAMALAVASAALAALLLWWRDSGAWMVVGLALAVGGGATLAAVALSSTLLDGSLASGSVLRREQVEVIGALLAVPARNAVITTCLGAVLATLGLARTVVRR